MEKDISCAYCMKDENPSLYSKFGYYICDLKVSTLYLFREQSHPGRCIVAYKDHVSEITELSDEEMYAFMKDVKTASEALHAVFAPAKVNYGAYGDSGHHLHMHLCPKYTGEFEWGGTFAMDPNLKKLSDEELKPIAEKIKAAIK